ncbi:MAG: hypothetical protein Ct9H300mP23_00450 [Nitrospinota bacterium]|nr:MAG: hypothetical protein Ct9H300mP23_00450 [Nitrospinota bacterium]
MVWGKITFLGQPDSWFAKISGESPFYDYAAQLCSFPWEVDSLAGLLFWVPIGENGTPKVAVALSPLATFLSWH